MHVIDGIAFRFGSGIVFADLGAIMWYVPINEESFPSIDYINCDICV